MASSLERRFGRCRLHRLVRIAHLTLCVQTLSTESHRASFPPVNGHDSRRLP